MKNLLRITGLFLLSALLSAPGCDGPGPAGTPDEGRELTAVKDSLREAFSSPDLSYRDLQAFAENARQKLAEFADYSNIFADESLDTAFRMQAKREIGGLFLPGTIVPVPVPGSFIRFDSVRVSAPLVPVEGNGYRGALAAFMVQTEVRGSDTVRSRKAVRAGIAAVRTPKAFGGDTLDVWEVFLEEIRPLP